MGIKITNNAYSELAAGLSTSATSITLTTGTGSRFPTLGAGDYFWGTIVAENNVDLMEIVKVTARSGDTLTVVRAQEGTVAGVWSTNDKFQLRITAQTMLDYSDVAHLTGVLPIAQGGTGSTTDAAARTALNVPTRTGGDASGTWGISITGTSRGVGTTDPMIGTGGLWVATATGLNVARNGTAYVALDAGNYNSYSPSLTGTGASGTWGISVTGNAGTATTLQTARTINGTSFNGSANITTASWGTARTLTIGATGKSVDGSGNVSWTLGEIGAVGSGNTMTINAEYSGTVAQNQTGWYTIASYGSGRAEATFHLSDQDSSRHNYVRANIVWSFGYGGIVVDTSGRHGVSTIRNIRLLYNTSDRTYGGVKVQVYCEGTSDQAWTLRVRQETTTTTGWGNFTEVTPVLEGTPAGWAEGYQAYYVNEQGQISTSSSSAYFAGNLALHSGNYNSYALPLSGGTLTGGLSGTTGSFSGAVTWGDGSSVMNAGNRRSLRIGYSGGNYGAAGYGIDFTTSSGVHNYALNDIVSLWEAYDGITVRAAAAGTVGTAVPWSTVLDARRSNSNMTFNGNVVLASNNYSSYSAFSGLVTSSGNNGFANATWFANVRNPIWSFANSSSYGISYFQGSAGRDGTDTITLHPNGSTTATGAAFAVNGNNAFVANNVVLHAGNYTSYVAPAGGSWYGSGLPGSRWYGWSVNGGEIVMGRDLPNNGQMGMLIDGCYIAGENNGFWSLASDNTWGSRRGFYWDGTNLNFTVNSPTAKFSNALIGENQVLHAGNYNSYAPTLGGTGASGTWGINITGNSASVTGGVYTSGDQTISGTKTFSTQIRANSIMGQEQWEGTITVGGDANTYYPVTWFGGDQDAVTEIEIFRNYAATAPWNPIGTGVHQGALTLKFACNFGGWGGSNYDIRVDHFRETYTTMVAEISRFGNERGFCVWLRGGTATYQVRVKGRNYGPTISYSAYDPGGNGSGVAPRTDLPRVNLRNHFSGGVLYSGGNAVLTTGNYNSYSPTLTGGGASGTWGINITGNAGTAYGLAVHGGRNNEANKVVRTDGNGYLQTGYINSSNGDENNASSPARVWGTNGSDSYLRTYQTTSLIVGYQAPTGNSNDWVQSFQQTPAHATSFREMSSNGPTGTWWMMQNFRHSNSSNYWGIQVAWGWEDNANNLYTRNISGNSFGSWVRYLNSGNYNSYSPTLTGGGASGTWGINISGSAAQLNGYSSAENGASVVLRTASNGYLYLYNWIHVASGGLFSGVNGAHFYPSNATYGAWRIDGSNNGWGGIAFGNGSTGIVNLMTASDSNSTGFHHQNYGWQFQWANGVFYIAKNAYGGNMATALDSSNYTNYAPAMGSSNTLTNIWYFRSNQNHGGSNPPLQAYSNDGGGAIMAFHRGGYYAVNMGLDSDNVFRIGGWSASANRLQMDMSGNLTMAGLVRAGTNFYADQNYGYGLVGVYASTRYQGVFAMGDSYKLPADGTSTGSLYGIAWSHPNAGGIAGNLTDHGMLIINNGGFRCAISNSIVASGNITAYSDERLKRNWRPMPDNFVERLAQVRNGLYERIDDGMEQVGVSAQSLQPLLPQAILKAKDEMGTLSVSYGNAAMASAVELAKEIVALKREIEILKSKLH